MSNRKFRKNLEEIHKQLMAGVTVGWPFTGDRYGPGRACATGAPRRLLRGQAGTAVLLRARGDFFEGGPSVRRGFRSGAGELILGAMGERVRAVPEHAGRAIITRADN